MDKSKNLAKTETIKPRGIPGKNHKLLQRKLKNGKVKRLSAYEVIMLNYLGKIDGKAGLVRLTSSGTWESPRLYQEADAYYEFCYQLWGAAEFALSGYYQELGILMAEIKRKESTLEQHLNKTPYQPAIEYLKKQKIGEEGLSSDQIYVRRKAEYLKENAACHAGMKAIENELYMAYARLDHNYYYIIALNNQTRLVCERVKNHTKQRRDIYWNAAFKAHPAHGSMPVFPEPLPDSDAEFIYTAQHEILKTAALDMLTRKTRITVARNETAAINIIKEVA